MSSPTYLHADDLFVGLAFVQRRSLGAAFVFIDSAHVIETHQPEVGGVEIVDMEPILHCVDAEVVSGSDYLAAFDPAARHPHRKAGGIMVASIAFLAHGSATEFPAPDDERGVEETA